MCAVRGERRRGQEGGARPRGGGMTGVTGGTKKA
jgi:hypothetical protein